MNRSSRGPLACGAVLAAFLGIGLRAVHHHEPWRDEIEIWLIARDSVSLGALFRNMATEGHPALWYLVNFVLTRFTRDPFAMQLVNLAIGAGAALLFFRAAPFGVGVRVFFAFGYYALFEFTVIARSYALELLLLFGFCAHAARRGSRMDLPGAALLVLLANTNLYGTMAAVALVASEAAEIVWNRERFGPRLRALGLAALGAAAGFGHVLWQSLGLGPAYGSGYPPAYNLHWLLGCIATPALGALPLPLPGVEHPWNSNVMLALPAPWHIVAAASLSVVLVLAAVAALRHRRRWLVAFLLGLAPMLALTLFVYSGSTRHHAHPFLWFLACAWLAGGLRREREAATGPPRLAEPVLVAVLAVQVLAGALLLRADHANAREAAAFLEQPEYRDAVLVGSVDFAAQTIAAWTRRPFFYVEQNRFGTFMNWDRSRRLVPIERALEAAIELSRNESRRVVLVLTGPRTLQEVTDVERRAGMRARYLAGFTDAIVESENYHLYRIERNEKTAPDVPVRNRPAARSRATPRLVSGRTLRRSARAPAAATRRSARARRHARRAPRPRRRAGRSGTPQRLP